MVWLTLGSGTAKEHMSQGTVVKFATESASKRILTTISAIVMSAETMRNAHVFVELHLISPTTAK